MRAFLISLSLLFTLSMTAHAASYSARADQNGNIEVQTDEGNWLSLDFRSRAKGGVVHVPPGMDPLFNNESMFDLRQISVSADGYRYFVLEAQLE